MALYLHVHSIQTHNHRILLFIAFKGAHYVKRTISSFHITCYIVKNKYLLDQSVIVRYVRSPISRVKVELNPQYAMKARPGRGRDLGNMNSTNISLSSMTVGVGWSTPHPGHFTYLLTPWCRVLLEKLTGLQLFKKFPAFHGTQRFITALTSVRHLSLS